MERELNLEWFVQWTVLLLHFLIYVLSRRSRLILRGLMIPFEWLIFIAVWSVKSRILWLLIDRLIYSRLGCFQGHLCFRRSWWERFFIWRLRLFLTSPRHCSVRQSRIIWFSCRKPCWLTHRYRDSYVKIARTGARDRWGHRRLHQKIDWLFLRKNYSWPGSLYFYSECPIKTLCGWIQVLERL